MNDTDLIKSLNIPATISSSVSPTRAKSFKVNSRTQNYAQYVSTVKAYALAGMPFEHIANAGDFLGDQVERGEVDASLIEGWQEKMGEVAEDESKILSWQNRGEIISITPQLSAPTTSGLDLVQSSTDLTTGQKQDQTINVVEGIAVFNEQPSSLQNSSDDNSALENNPYLKSLPDLKKAA